MTIYCTHEECRTDTLQELSAMGYAIPARQSEFFTKAMAALKLQVRCRKIPSRGKSGGSPQAPFPGED